MLILLAYIVTLALIAKFALDRRNKRRSTTKKLHLTKVIAPSDALIDKMPQEILLKIIKCDISNAIRSREVSKYWRSLISDRDLDYFVLRRAKEGRDLLKSLLEACNCDSDFASSSNFYYDAAQQKWVEKEEPILVTKELTRNVCAAEKRGKYFVELKDTNILRNLRKSSATTDKFNDFVMQVEGVITSNTYDNKYRNCITLYDTDYEQYLIRRPNTVPLPRLSASPVKLTFNLGEFLTALPVALTLRDPVYRLRLIEYHIEDPLIWTLGLFANSADILVPVVSLLIWPWICSFITPLLPSWTFYSTIIVILVVFALSSNKHHRSIFMYELAAAVWFTFTVGSSQYINNNSTFYVPIYETIGNFLWTAVFYAYAELGSGYLKQQKVDPTRKILTSFCVLLAIYTSLTVLPNTMISDTIVWSANNSIILLGHNLKYLFGATVYLILTARIFGITFRELFSLQMRRVVSFAFAAKFCAAILLRLLFQVHAS